MKKYSLGILQSHATQFDGPFFRFVSSAPDIELTVYYSRQVEGREVFDHEIGRAPQWDHMVESGYRRLYKGRGLLAGLRFILGCARSKHDLLIVNGYKQVAVLVVLLCRLMKVPVGLRSDNILPEYDPSGWKGMLKRHLLPVLFRLYNTGHPVGSLAAQYLIHFGFRREQLFRFPYSVDAQYLDNLCQNYRKSRHYLRERMGIKREAFVALGIMKFNEREDPMTLLNGWRLMSDNTDGIHLVLIGDGPMKAKITAFINQNRIQSITLPGYRPYSELPLYFAISDVFIHTALRGSWEVSVHEALSCGIPVIVADTVGCTCDLVFEKETGLVFEAGNSFSLAESIKKMMHDNCFRIGCKVQSRCIANRWSYEATLEDLRAALKWVR